MEYFFALELYPIFLIFKNKMRDLDSTTIGISYQHCSTSLKISITYQLFFQLMQAEISYVYFY